MAIDFQPFTWPIMGGVDTKIDGLALPAPRLQACTNAFSDKTGSLQRRQGFDALATTDIANAAITNPIALANYQQQLMGFSSRKAYEYATGVSKWIDKGAQQSFRIRARDVLNAEVDRTPGPMDMATAGSVTAYAAMLYTTSGANIVSTIRLTVADADGTIYTNEKQLYTVTAVAGEFYPVRCIAFGTFIYVFYFDSGLADLMVFLIDTTSAATITSSLAASAVSVATDIHATVPIFDVAANSTFNSVLVAYRTTAGAPGVIKFGFVSSAGALTNTSTLATVAVPISLAMEAVSTASARMGFTYLTGANPNDVYASIQSWSGAAWSATTSGAIETTLAGALAMGVYCVWASNGTTLNIFYSGENGGAGTSNRTFISTFTTGAVATARVTTLRHSTMMAQPFLGSDSQLYYWVFAGPLSGSTPTAFLMTGTTPVAWLHTDVQRAPFASTPVTIPGVVTSGSSYSFMTSYMTRLTGGGQAMNRAVTVDMVHAQSHDNLEVGQSLYLSGGFLQQYDGVSFVESGFLRTVVNFSGFAGDQQVTLTASLAGALTVGAAYAYRVVPEWTNIRGEREQGTDTGSQSRTIGAGEGGVNVNIPTISHTLKKSPRANLKFAVYRTGPNPSSDAEFHRAGVIENDPTAETVVFVDLTADVSGNERLYLDAGVLDNISPPSGYILAQGGERVFVAGVAGAPNTIYVSKARLFTDPLSFAAELQIQCPEEGGAITALEVMNETLVVFKERRIYRCRADLAPNNTLTLGAFDSPVLVTSDTGCTGQRSVVAGPMGIMFQGAKGIMLLDQGFNVSYLGAPVEASGSGGPIGSISSACLVPAKQQVRMADGNNTYVFDYYHKQWYVYTVQTFGPSVVVGGVYKTPTAAGPWSEATATYADAGSAYVMVIAIGWSKFPGTMQGDLRFRRVGITGTSLDAHNVTIAVRYDYEGFTTQSIYDSAAAAGPLRLQKRLGKQIATALQIFILDADVSSVAQATAGMRLNEVVLEVGVRSGLASRRLT